MLVSSAGPFVVALPDLLGSCFLAVVELDRASQQLTAVPVAELALGLPMLDEMEYLAPKSC